MRNRVVRTFAGAVLTACTCICTSCIDLDALFVFRQTEAITGYDFSATGLSGLSEAEWSHAVIDAGSVPLNGIWITGVKPGSRSGSRIVHQKRKTVLHFPGNESNLYNAIAMGLVLRDLGYNSFGIEYRGYGPSAPDFEISEKSILEDGNLAFRYLTETMGLRPDDIVILGYSLGSAVAVDLAAREGAYGLVLMAPMYSGDSLGSNIGGGYHIPSGAFVSARLDNASKISGVRSPILFLHGMNDLLIPYENSVELRKCAVQAPLTRLEINLDSDHMQLPGRSGWYGPIMQSFIDIACSLQPVP